MLATVISIFNCILGGKKLEAVKHEENCGGGDEER